ncbi:hypothetical protein PROFUN_10028, partial [Planoprotostelium fungivorum]
ASEIVRSCSKCQQFNIVRRGYYPTRPILSKMPGDHLAIDLAGPLPTTDRGNNYLFIAVDICTRFCFLHPMIDKTSATTVTHLIDYCTIFGFPRILQSDNGTEFVNELMKLLKETAGFDHRLITPYHAAANGTAERWVQNALNVIRKMIDGARHDWDLYVPSTQYALNVKIAARHGSTPFSLMFNRSPNGFNDFTGSLGLHPFDGEAYAARIEQFANIVFPAINEKVQKYIDASTKDRHLTSFPDGSFVMTVNKSRTNKLEARYEGPFKVLRRNKGGAYILQDTDSLTLSRNYTTEELKLISHDPDEHGKSYVIERIIQHRGTAPNYEYLVKWKGYTAKYNTLEPTDSFDSTASIDAYWTRLKESQKKKGGDVVTTVRHKTKSSKDLKTTSRDRRKKSRLILALSLCSNSTNNFTNISNVYSFYKDSDAKLFTLTCISDILYVYPIVPAPMTITFTLNRHCGLLVLQYPWQYWQKYINCCCADCCYTATQQKMVTTHLMDDVYWKQSDLLVPQRSNSYDQRACQILGRVAGQFSHFFQVERHMAYTVSFLLPLMTVPSCSIPISFTTSQTYATLSSSQRDSNSHVGYRVKTGLCRSLHVGNQQPQKKNIAAIIGGVVRGVMGVAVIAAIVISVVQQALESNIGMNTA